MTLRQQKLNKMPETLAQWQDDHPGCHVSNCRFDLHKGSLELSYFDPDSIKSTAINILVF